MTTLAGRPVLVLGGTGFLGSHIVDRLLAVGASVAVFARPASHRHRLAHLGPLAVHEGDLTHPDDVADAVVQIRPRLIVHAAGDVRAREGDDDLATWLRATRVHVDGTLALLDAVRRVVPDARVVRAGSMEEYGDGPSPYVETQRERAVSAYSAAHVSATQAAHAAARRWGVTLTTLRPALVYGPRQDDHFLVPGVIDAALAGRDFAMTAGLQSVDVVYAGDVADAFARALVADGVAGEILNVGTGAAVSVRALAARIVSRAGADIALRTGDVTRRPGEADVRRLDVGRARALLGWTATTSLDEGLDRTIAWYRDQA